MASAAESLVRQYFGAEAMVRRSLDGSVAGSLNGSMTDPTPDRPYPPLKTIAVVVNPFSGNGRGKKALEKVVLPRLIKNGLIPDEHVFVFRTEYALHATEICEHEPASTAQKWSWHINFV